MMLATYVKRGGLLTVIYALSAAMMRSINFLFLPYFLTLLSLADFGIWDFYQTIFVRGAMIITTLATSALTRFYFVHKDDPGKQQQAIANALVLMSIATTIFFCASYWYLHNTAACCQYTRMTIIITACYAFFSFVVSLLRTQEKLGWYLVLFCGQNIFSSLGSFVGIYYGFGNIAFFYATLYSLLIFIPIFILLHLRYHTIDMHMLKEQCVYAVPLLLFTIINVSIFAVDRFFIKFYIDSTANGIYGILWRFASIFQILATAFIDAWPNIIFNACQYNNQKVLQQLARYALYFLLFSCLATLAFSHSLFAWCIPTRNQALLLYLPSLFCSLLLYELGRLFQTGCLLAKRTVLIPWIGIFCLAIQCIGYYICLYIKIPITLWHILCINNLAFACYAVLSLCYSNVTYANNLFEHKKLISILLLFLVYCGILQYLMQYADYWYFSLALLFSWPIVIFFAYLDQQTRIYLRNNHLLKI